MNKVGAYIKYLRLSLLFAFAVFLIIACTMGLVFGGAQLLAHFGVIDLSTLHRFLIRISPPR